MKKEYIQENNNLFKAFLETTFFKNWRAAERQEKKEDEFPILNYSMIELDIGYKCSLNCRYCYYARYGKELYQNVPIKAKDILDNTEKLMNFLWKNKMYADYDLFSGEPFMLPYIWDWFDIVYKYLEKTEISKRTRMISIPSNLSFLKDSNEKDLNTLRKYIKKFQKIDVILGISGSFDGPFMDEVNRPEISKNAKYNKNFYDKFASLSEEFSMGAHPMIYSNNIEYWPDNFLWFLENSRNLYLLDVRNWEWTVEQDKHLFYTMRFIVNLLFKMAKEKNVDPFEFILENNFNILTSPFNTTGRGIGCSIQSTLEIALHTMEIVPCHRTSYSNLATGKLILNDDGSYDVDTTNVELYLSEQATDAVSLSPCTSCPISTLCSGSCLGANYEATGDMYTVPPSFCRESMAKIGGIIKGCEDVGIISRFYDRTGLYESSQIQFVLDSFEGV